MPADRPRYPPPAHTPMELHARLTGFCRGRTGDAASLPQVEPPMESFSGSGAGDWKSFMQANEEGHTYGIEEEGGEEVPPTESVAQDDAAVGADGETAARGGASDKSPDTVQGGAKIKDKVAVAPPSGAGDISVLNGQGTSGSGSNVDGGDTSGGDESGGDESGGDEGGGGEGGGDDNGKGGGSGNFGPVTTLPADGGGEAKVVCAL